MGAGQIGTMLGSALRASGAATEVAVWDRDRDHLRECLSLGGGDRALAGEADALALDAVVLALPVAAVVRWVEALGPRLSPGQLVIDTGSAKVAVADAMGKWVPATALAAGGHPICGNEGSGPRAADPGCLRGAAFVVTPVREDSRALERATDLVVAVGATPVIISAAEHDRVLARTSHLPHLVAYALSQVCADAGGVYGLSGGGLVSATRLAASDPEMVASFLLANRDQLTPAVGSLVAELEALVEADQPSLVRRLEAARRARSELVGRSA